MYKEFEQHEFDVYDAPARDRAKTFWEHAGYHCEDHEDQFGVDLVVRGKGKTFYCEVEVKKSWHGVKFSYSTLHIPVRKAKFLTKPTQFLVFNAGLHAVARVGRKTVAAAPCVEVPNYKSPFRERFYDIPAEEVSFYTLGSVN
jgi:hypothetical protein